ncbi:hypothetical protein GCM10027217_21400 [Pseudomaricurvus hydrocarbonicus]
MNAQDLIKELNNPSSRQTEVCCSTPLPLEDAAKIAALVELHPHHTTESIITALLHHALNNISPPVGTREH